jgi:pimeloyl-ACP methyl ester carboxylesterase
MILATLAALAIAGEGAAEGVPCRGEGQYRIAHKQSVLNAQVQGSGPVVLLIPSLGRGPADFDHLANVVATSGYSALRFEPRWFGESNGPEDASLKDLASDAVAVVDAFCPSATFAIVGHAFGNRVARAIASNSPARVNGIVLLAAGGKAPVSEQVLEAITVSASEGLIDNHNRLSALQTAFFAPTNDPSVWLTGWSPRAAELQSKANRSTDRATWWSGGTADILVLQAEYDPVAPVENGRSLEREHGNRVTIASLPRASHAMLPEQPEAIAAAILLWLSGERSQFKIQEAIVARVR